MPGCIAATIAGLSLRARTNEVEFESADILSLAPPRNRSRGNRIPTPIPERAEFPACPSGQRRPEENSIQPEEAGRSDLVKRAFRRADNAGSSQTSMAMAGRSREWLRELDIEAPKPARVECHTNAAWTSSRESGEATDGPQSTPKG